MPSGYYADAGGGTSDHAALSNLDYPSAAHTGFAGTDTANIFTQPQQFTIAGLSVASLLQNSDFDSDINNWDDSGSSWTWNATGAAEHTPGSASTLSQTFAISGFSLYVLSISVTNVTAGSLTVSDDFGINGLIDADATIVFPAQHVSGASNTIYLTPSSDFAGLVDYVYAQPIYSMIAMLDVTGNLTPARIFGTSIESDRSILQAMRDDISGRWVWVEDVSGWE